MKQGTEQIGFTAQDFDAMSNTVDVVIGSLRKKLGAIADRIGRNGLDTMVADLKTAGLSFDDITTDADELAGAIGRLDEVGQTI